MNVIDTDIPDIKILEPKVFSDERGFFFESYNQKVLEDKLRTPFPFVQDNHSFSVKGVLRGLHYQTKKPQGKLLRVVSGEVFDVAVDMRKSSLTFGRWVGLHLSSSNRRMLWIPPGFAHGFLAISPSVDFLYKATDFYDPSSECCLRWDDPDLKIAWPVMNSMIISPKDSQGKYFHEAIYFP